MGNRIAIVLALLSIAINAATCYSHERHQREMEEEFGWLNESAHIREPVAWLSDVELRRGTWERVGSGASSTPDPLGHNWWLRRLDFPCASSYDECRAFILGDDAAATAPRVREP